MKAQEIVNISGYKFVDIPESELLALREELRSRTREIGLKGTILLSTEGINCFVGATQDIIDQFKTLLNEYPYFNSIWFKVSASVDVPYKRMLVKVKKEIIAMGEDSISPLRETAKQLPPEILKKWYDEGKDMIVIDTRNEYEIQLGTFENALDLHIRNFRQFPTATKQLSPEMKKKPVVTFCTGGIRCEKAGAYLMSEGFEEVYQLEGGIINYFEKVGGAHYQGECFVFDKRVAVDENLKETATIQCFKCRGPVTVPRQAQGICPYCGDTEIGQRVGQQQAL